MKKHKLLSLFSGCGGMDIGFEGGFSCLSKSINPDWVQKKNILKNNLLIGIFGGELYNALPEMQ